MYISNVHIENFRNFTNIDISLNQFTILVGKNDVGKSNLIDAINIFLYNSKGNFYSKNLSKYDFNNTAQEIFKTNVTDLYNSCFFNGKFEIDNFLEKVFKIAPVIKIKLTFKDPKDSYEKSLLRDWLNGDETIQYFAIEYKFSLTNKKRLKDSIEILISENLFENYYYNFEMYLSCYDYKFYSVNNNQDINYTKIKNFAANIINAERDSFSNDENIYSSKIISKILDNGLHIKDRITLQEKYNEFFQSIQTLNTFKDIYQDITEQNEDISKFIEQIVLKPNAKKYKNILENITLSYGNDMMFQRGLGTRNLIFILTLYSYFISDNEKRFNFLCIEEPESHLDINNLKLAIEFIQKAKDKNTLTQLLLSTHNNHIINKLSMNNITLLIDDKEAVNFLDIDQDLVYYLAKRENFDTMNLLFAEKLILVEGATEEIFLTCILNKDKINNIKIISIGQKGFTTFIQLWLKSHKEPDKLGIIRDYDNQPQAKINHEKYNCNSILIKTSSGKEFENDLVNEDNLFILNEIFNTKYDNEKMIEYLTSNKLNSILTISKAIENNKNINIPNYIKNILEWL